MSWFSLTYGRLYIKRNNLDDEQVNELNSKLTKIWNCGKLKYELFLDDEQKTIFGFRAQHQLLI